MNFISDRIQNTEEWMWYEKYIVNYLLHQLRLTDRFTSADIQRAIGLINVNAVALKYPMNSTRKEAVHFNILPFLDMLSKQILVMHKRPK